MAPGSVGFCSVVIRADETKRQRLTVAGPMILELSEVRSEGSMCNRSATGSIAGGVLVWETETCPGTCWFEGKIPPFHLSTPLHSHYLMLQVQAQDSTELCGLFPEQLQGQHLDFSLELSLSALDPEGPVHG